MKRFIKSILIIIGMFLLLILFNGLLDLLIKNDSISLCIAYFIVCIILVFIFKDELKFKMFDKKMFKYFGLFILCYFLTSIVNGLIYYFVDIESSTQAANEAFILNNKILSILTVGIMGPFMEEIIFRLNFKKSINNKLIFILVTGILFGGAHLIGVTNLVEYLYIIPYSIMGIFLSYIYIDSDNIYTSLFFHSLNNLIILVLLIVVG